MRDFPLAIDIEDIDFMGHVNKFALSEIWAGNGYRTLAAVRISGGGRDLCMDRTQARDRSSQTGIPSDWLTANVVRQQVRRESGFYEPTIRRGSEVVAKVKSRLCCIDAMSRCPVRNPPPSWHAACRNVR